MRLPEGQKSRHRPEAEVNGRYLILNWKGFEETWPAWKRAFFWCVYRPFYQFSKHVLKLPTFSAQDEQGRVCWLELSGWVTEKWKAIQICESKGWTWGYQFLPEEYLLADETLPGNLDHSYPASSSNGRYLKNGQRNPEEKIALGQLIEVTARARQTLAAHK